MNKALIAATVPGLVYMKDEIIYNVNGFIYFVNDFYNLTVVRLMSALGGGL